MKNNNNPNSLKKFIASTAMAGALLAAASCFAGQATTNVFSFSGSVGAWWLNSWGTQSGGTAYDATQDHTGDSGGSLHCVDDFSGGDQSVNIGWIGGQQWGGNPYDLTGWTNISLYVKWDTSVSTIEITNFNSSGGDNQIQLYGSTANNGGWFTLGQFYLPPAASNGWVKVNVPVDPTIPGATACYVLGIKKYTGSGKTGVAAFWVDDITLEGNPAAAIPNPTMKGLSKPVSGLNLFALSGPYNRESLESVNDQSWINQSGPVSYSFTVAQGVDGSGGAAYQNHIFLAPSPGTESGPDWNEANTIMLDLENTTAGGASWTFRYKTNQPNANSMMYDTNFVPGNIGNSTPVGTWTLTFNSANNITMTTPSGASTNFTIPADAAALFTSPVQAYFGCQAGNTAGIGQHSVLSEIKITGTANPLDDVFTGGAGVNANNWTTNAVDGGAVFVTPSDAAYWLAWSLPDNGFALQSISTLSGGLWNDLTPPRLQGNGQRLALLRNADMPAAQQGFFRLIKRQFSQLQVLLPGETNAPNTLTGKTGTPTSVSTGSEVDVTVNAVDATYHIVNVSDTVHLTCTDLGAILPNDASMVNGTLTFTTLYLNDSGSWTVTATDIGNNAIPPATSSSITVP